MNHNSHFVTSKLSVLVLLCVFALLSCQGNSDVQEAEKKAPVRYVKSMVITSGDALYEQRFSGRLHSTSEVNYSFRVSGTIKDLRVKIGDEVKKGAVLATLDATDYELEVERAQAALSRSQATLRNAQSQYERVKLLYQAGNTSRNDLDNARAGAETAEAVVQTDRKALQIRRNNLSYTTLRSDSDCSIAEVRPDKGENVVSGQQVIFAACGDDLEVKLDIPESVISFVQKDMPVMVTFPAIADTTFRGRVSEVGVSSVGSGTTFPVDVLITDSDKSDLKAGLSANVVFTIDASLRDSLPVIEVPSFAVNQDDAGRFVYAVEQNAQGASVIKRVSVTIGEVRPTGVEITQGIDPGMRVVTAGVSVLRDGMEVKVDEVQGKK